MIDETLNDPAVVFDTASLYIMYASELAAARELDAAFTEHFIGEGENELANEHIESAKKWIEYLQLEFPENPKVDALAVRLNELTDR